MAWYLLLLALVLYLNISGKSIKEQDKTPFGLDDFLNNHFKAKTWNGSWTSGNTIQFMNRNNDIMEYNVETRTTTKFLGDTLTARYAHMGSSIKISKDYKYAAIRYNVTTVFRKSTTAVFAIYDIENDKYYDIADKARVQLTAWAPVGHGFIYVLDNNIYYLEDPTLVDSPKAITEDGIPGVIFNGVPDWTYEEEVLGGVSALWFAPDGKRLAFCKYNDTNIKDFDYVLYGKPGDMSSQYPSIARIRYPKPGTPDPTVQTYVVDLSSGERKELSVIPQRFLPDNYILFALDWITNDEVAVLCSNKVANESELVRCNLDLTCQTEATRKQEKGWLDLKMPKYNGAGNKRVEVLPQPEGNDFYNHLVLTDSATKAAKRLTQGRFDVIAILSWDEKKNFVYFTGSGADGKLSQVHAYVVNVATGEVTCLTCDPPAPDRVCFHGSASFSTDLSYYVKTCSGPDPNFIQIVKSPEIDAANKIAQPDFEPIIWQDNQAVVDKWAKKLRPTVKDFKVPIAGTEYDANVRLLLPPNFNENAKYPILNYVYAGPGANQVTDDYTLMSGFEMYLTSSRNYIYCYIDARGSGHDGHKKKFEMYRRLGTVEIQDQISVMKYLQDNLKYIDANRTGLWGWSYGGYAAGWIIAQDKEKVYKFGVSVGPVTNMFLYNTVYSHRYMGLPTKDDNLAGYDAQDLTRNVEGFRGKKFLIVHGSGDDNVHYQHTALLSKALQRADIPFQQQTYPDEQHSLTHLWPHFYHTLDRFFARSMGLPDPPYTKLVR